MKILIILNLIILELFSYSFAQAMGKLKAAEQELSETNQNASTSSSLLLLPPRQTVRSIGTVKWEIAADLLDNDADLSEVIVQTEYESVEGQKAITWQFILRKNTDGTYVQQTYFKGELKNETTH